MRGRGWSNGSPSPSGAGYGIAISTSDRDRHFSRDLRTVTLMLENGPTVTVSLSDSFWRKCSEFRSAEIGRWLIGRGLAPWPKGKPPRLELEVVEPGLLHVRSSS